MRYSFANCSLCTESHTFEREGESISVEPQVFDLLHLLVENAGKLVSKDQLVETVWNGRIVSDATISARINAARVAVGDTGSSQAIIQTVPRRGIKMVVPVKTTEQIQSDESAGDTRQIVRFANSADGTKIAYATTGQGRKILRAGHFLTHLERDWSSPVWRPYLEALSAHHTLVRYDQRGTGLSEPNVESFDVEAYVADMLAVADAANMDRFPLIASSQGVPVSIVFAARHPERVSSLVLYGGFAEGRARRDHGYAQEEADALLSMIRVGWGNPESAFMTAFTSVFCPGASREEIENLVAIQLASTSAENAARIRIAIDQIDVVEYLSKVTAPTLVIHSSNDAVHPVSQGRLVASQIADAEFQQFDSNNHILLPSDPAWKPIVDAQLSFVQGR